MNFQELLDQLPDCPGSRVLQITDKPGGFRYIGQGIPEFVGPDLLPSSQIEQPTQARIMVISAAGAVGKSTLAREIAARKHAPMWDLAEAPVVGGNSMNGQLTASFGYSLAGRVSQELTNGGLFLVIDALDEARMKANEAGFQAFVENIAEIAKTSSRTSFVLLGRTQTAETTWLLLEDAGVPASLISIQPFTRAQAEEYIELRIKHFGVAAAKRIASHRKPFIEARDLILDHLERAVGGESAFKNEAAREFLGYAPVLETVAVLLAKESNYQDLISSLNVPTEKRPDQETNRPLAILDHVVKRLLEREHSEKLQNNIKPVLEKVAAQAGWGAWDTLYLPNEQRMRLLGRILHLDIDACPKMPSTVRAKYEEQLKVWLPEHPFLREGSEPANKVFESYLFATAMREYMTPVSHLVEKRIATRDYKPSRLLADFYILLGEQRGEEVVAERQIGLLYDSLLAGETDSLRVRFSVESGDPEEPDEEDDMGGEGQFELVYEAQGAEVEEQIETRSFKIVEEEGLIVFRRQVKEATIVTSGTVMLGGDVDDFEIGPAVDIRCGKLEIRSAGMVVRPGSRGRPLESDRVVLEALECVSTMSRSPLVRGALFVSWPGADAHPWRDFLFSANDEQVTHEQMHTAYRRFRRIATTLRSHSRGSLARYRAKIDHRRVLGGEPGRAVLNRLLADGILVLKGNFYHWNPRRADELLKVSHGDLRLRRASPELRAYLEDIIARNPNAF